MLRTAGFPMSQIVPTLGAASVLGTVAGFIALPVVVLAASAAGSDVESSLIVAMWIGAALLSLILIAIMAVAARDHPWHWMAGAVSRVRGRLGRSSDAEKLEQRLLRERD